ncbi:MAG: cysteine hydrolase family protein [Gemmatimonadota bacterium]|nr:cysteine hydrolase family protein [Gemmatimonadota bacterium]MDP6801997.1 cysteine hydrolase family protein [Gemmatimonadota bacterium]MDP7031345.1 cysteine hydrolase family protein [Gemmatimonadota bacterium]
MDSGKSALILIGYQNDYFAPNGILHHVIEEASRVSGVLQNTLDLVERVSSTDMLIVSTPILFTENYEELVDPVGILKTIKEVGAFREDTQGGKTIDEIARFGDRIVEVPGKRGLNAFSNTELEALYVRVHGGEAGEVWRGRSGDGVSAKAVHSGGTDADRASGSGCGRPGSALTPGAGPATTGRPAVPPRRSAWRSAG